MMSELVRVFSRWRWWGGVISVLFVAGIAGLFYQHSQDDAGRLNDGLADHDSRSSMLDEWKILTAGAKSVGGIFQPSANQIEAYSRLIRLEKGNVHQGLHLHEYLPYIRYMYTVESGAYVFHPSQAAWYLIQKYNHPDVMKMVKAMMDVGVPLPNGGVAWYYPKHYRNARMLGPDERYSAFGQASVLADLPPVIVPLPELE